MTPLEITAAYLAERLRESVHPDVYPSARRELLRESKSELAHALAADETGVTRNEAKLISTYSRAELSLDQIERANAYNLARIRHAQSLETHRVDELAVVCEAIAGERTAVPALAFA